MVVSCSIHKNYPLYICTGISAAGHENTSRANPGANQICTSPDVRSRPTLDTQLASKEFIMVRICRGLESPGHRRLRVRALVYRL